MRTLFFVVCVLTAPFCVSRPKYGMLLLVVLQAALLGNSADLETGKFIYAAIFCFYLISWIPSLLNERGRWWKHPIVRSVKWLLFLFALSRLVGMYHGISAIDWFRDLTPMLNYIWIPFGVVAFSAKDNLRRYCRLLVILLAILSIISTAQIMVFRGFLPDPIDFFDAVNVTPVVVLFGVFLSISLAIDNADKRSRIRSWACAGGFVVCSLLTGTRINTVSILVGSMVFFLLLRRVGAIRRSGTMMKILLPVAAATVLMVVTAAYALPDADKLVERYKEPLSADFLEDATLTNRIAESLDAWNAFAASPVFGQGLGYKMETVFRLGFDYYIPEMYFVHNFYFYILAKFGLLGLVSFAVFFAAVIRSSVRGFLASAPGIERALYGGVASLMVALLIESITSAQFNERFPTAFLSILLGLIVAIDIKRARNASKRNLIGPDSNIQPCPQS